MFAPALVAGLLAAGASISWTRDYTKAFAQAEEQRLPVLLFFRSNCGGGNTPQNPLAVTVTAPRGEASGGPIEHQEGLSACDRMQEDVWENPAVVSLVERYIPVVLDAGDKTLEVRYQAVRMPTTLITDPWGNEVFRTTGYLERDKMARILEAVPRDFAPLAPAGQTLKANPTDFGALTSAARFYEGAGLPQVSDRLYAAALAAPGGMDVARAPSGRHQPRTHPDGASQPRGGGGLPLREGARGCSRRSRLRCPAPRPRQRPPDPGQAQGGGGGLKQMESRFAASPLHRAREREPGRNPEVAQRGRTYAPRRPPVFRMSRMSEMVMPLSAAFTMS
jgi:hypothetical protein